MDTGLSPHLEAVIARHPGWTISRNPDWPYRWEAVSHPTPSSEVYTHAGSLAELDAALDAGVPA